MADNEIDKSFPKIAESNWWKLRNLFKQKVPASVTTTYLSAALSMSEVSANRNVIIPFKKMGILDDTGKPTDLAYDWRDDSKYPEVCQKLLESIYPEEVRNLFPAIDSDQKALTTWFMNYCRCGEAAAKMYASFYRLLLKADPSQPTETLLQKKKTTITVKPPKTSLSKKLTEAGQKEQESLDRENLSQPDKLHGSHGRMPQLHINIQLHIAPETTPEQIDKIFESMARHLKDFRI